MSDNYDDWITTADAAKAMGLATSTLYADVAAQVPPEQADGGVRGVRVRRFGGTVRFYAPDLAPRSQADRPVPEQAHRLESE